MDFRGMQHITFQHTLLFPRDIMASGDDNVVCYKGNGQTKGNFCEKLWTMTIQIWIIVTSC